MAGSDSDRTEWNEGTEPVARSAGAAAVPVDEMKSEEQTGDDPGHAEVEDEPFPLPEEEPDGWTTAEQDLNVPHDPGVDPEDEGIPDLQDGTPEQQRASDPQQEPVPGDTPTAPTRSAPTPAELHEGASLDERLAEEEPEAEPSWPQAPASSDRTGRLYEEAEPRPPRRQDVYAQEFEQQGLSAEEEAVRAPEEEA